MRLAKARVTGYRSIIDTGYFDIEELKTILVGPNEAGKTAILQAIQKLNPPVGVHPFDPLHDYPRALYNEDIERKGIDINNFTVVEGVLELSDEDKALMPDVFKDIKYHYGKYLNNKTWHKLEGNYPKLTYKILQNDIDRLFAHIDRNAENEATSNGSIYKKPSDSLPTYLITKTEELTIEDADQIVKILKANLTYIDEGGKEEERYNKLLDLLAIPSKHKKALEICQSLLPKFIYFDNYFSINPTLDLDKLADKIDRNLLEKYDYANICLLKYLGFTARELSEMARTGKREDLDRRQYRLNAASVELSNVIQEIWNPNAAKQEASKLRIFADGQYLKVVVEDDLGVEVELNQRSAGFQWMVSFFVVFFAEAQDKHKNAILLLDEPGMSLHGLKQAEFRNTLSKLSKKNQTIFTTHSPFLVGADELDLVRVVEMPNRREGTKVSLTVTSGDTSAMLPLQEALGYNLAQSLFMQEKNLVLEGLTDYWYLEGISALLKTSGKTGLNDNIALIPADCASKVVYFATILHAQNLKVAALLDSDAAGEQAATQDTLVSALGNKKILRTKDVYNGAVKKCEIEDILRESLINIAKDDLGWDVSNDATQQPSRPIVDVFSSVIGINFSKYKLAKSFLKWTKGNDFATLNATEQKQCELLIEKINKVLS